MLKVMIAEDGLPKTDLPEDGLLANGPAVWGVARTIEDGAAPGQLCTEPVAPLLGSDLPVLDQATLGRIARLLKPGAIVTHLGALAEKCAALLRGLRAPGAFIDTGAALADTAHQLAGNCGMLGFERLAFVARRFEDAARVAPTQAAALAADICAALEATIEEIDANKRSLTLNHLYEPSVQRTRSATSTPACCPPWTAI